MSSRSRTSSTLIRPSASHRLPSTRTTSGSSSGSNSSGRSPTRAPSRSLTVSTPSTPPCSSTTTAKARRCRRISASTSSTRWDSGTRKGWRSRREMSIGSGVAGGADPSGRRGSAGRVTGPADLPAGPEQVVDEEHPDQVVEVVAVDREAAVARLPHRLGHRVDGERDRQGHHVDPGGHDLPDHRVVEVVEGIDDELLLGVGPAVGPGPGAAAPDPALPARWRWIVFVASEHGHGGDAVCWAGAVRRRRIRAWKPQREAGRTRRSRCPRRAGRSPPGAAGSGRGA